MSLMFPLVPCSRTTSGAAAVAELGTSMTTDAGVCATPANDQSTGIVVTVICAASLAPDRLGRSAAPSPSRSAALVERGRVRVDMHAPFVGERYDDRQGE